MNTKFNRLCQPFPESSIEYVVTWTYGDSYEDVMIGVAPYIKRESVIVRLDHVIGPEHWKNEISPQSYGLYNGISIQVEPGNWITKWDGSEMGKTGGQIDAIKSVSTLSLRRSAELWGIGRYLKDLPQLFAVKRPSDEYDADEKTQIKRGQNKFNVRWDHPVIPKEFLPRTMTPEQYYLLSGLTKYFPEDKIGPVKQILDDFLNDDTSVPYLTAKKKIEDIRAYVEKNVNYHGPKTIYTQPLAGHKPPNNESTPDPKPRQETTHPPAKQQGNKSDNNAIETTPEKYAEKFRDLKKLLTQLLEMDFKNTDWNKDLIQKDYNALQDSVKHKTPIPEGDIDKLISSYSRAMVDLTPDDDEEQSLPF